MTKLPSLTVLFEATFTSVLKIKSQKESQNRRNQEFSYYFCMMIEGSGSRAGSGSGSIPPTSGSGSGRPKNMWIRIRILNTALKWLCGMCFFCLWPPPLLWPHTPPYTVYVYVYCKLIHTGRGGELTREKVRGTTVHKAGSKILTWVTITPVFKLC